MALPRPLLACALGGLALGSLVALGGSLLAWAGHPIPGWPAAHGWILTGGFLLPALAFVQFHLLARHVGARIDPGDEQMLAGLYGAAMVLVPLGQLLPRALEPVFPFAVLGFSGFLLLAGTGMAQLLVTVRTVPRASVVDVVRDPLTKGDDASLKQLRFAHFMLPPGLLLIALANGPGLGDWRAGPNLELAGWHLVLGGYGLLSIYGLSHLVVPRLSGIPAIAAGAIKGELHSSLLGLVLLTAGFLSRGTGWSTGLLVAGGVFLFFGAFVFMGVLGANIMKNKSRTQRVTPEFAYVPWTFAGVFWLIAGTLMGVFLNAVPDLFADRMPALRFTHLHAVALGGFVALLLGYVMRIVPRATLPFQRTRLAFLAINAGLLVMVVGALGSGTASTTSLVGVALVVLGLAAWFAGLRRHLGATMA